MSEERIYPSGDSVATELLEFEGRLRTELAGLATVARTESEGGFPRFALDPENPRSTSLVWLDWGNEILLLSTNPEGAWHIDRTPEGVRLLASAVRAVIGGRVQETSTYGGWRVEIDGDAGKLVFDARTPVELLPRLRLPARLRRTKVTQPEPYTSA